MRSDQLQAHYDRLADKFDRLWFYSDDFVAQISAASITHLQLRPEDQLVDLGCGTGIYAKQIRSRVPLRHDLLCVDFSREMLAQLPAGPGYRPIHLTAEEFARQPISYDKLLIKELIHHIKDPATLFRQLYAQLRNSGRLLVIMLPPKIGYPLFDAALRLYQQQQPHYDSICQALEQAGFSVEVSFVEYPLAIEREVYMQMVAQRYMSLLAAFDDDQLGQGLAEMEQRYQDTPVLHFTDRFVFITATKA